jgi:HlyD family secretion protein
MNPRNKKVLVILIFLVALILLAFQFLGNENGSVVYKTALVDRGEISSYVTATGTVNPVTTVEIGSQVPGSISKIYADFNSLVKKGQSLAEIDPASFKAKVEQVQADLKKAQADTELTRNIMNANEELYKKRLISKQEYEDSKVKYSSAVAALQQAKAALEIASSDLTHTIIRSPIDGIVMSSRVNVGQAVGTGRESTPLFIIAEDLSRINVVAHVSEADVGKVDSNQRSVFTVDAYPNQTFEGKVWQVRNEPITANNVVTYDVVIRVDNEELRLKPGMTAEVKILVAHKADVLRVPRAALRFIPPPSASIEENSRELDSVSVVWTAQRSGQLKAVPITSGISDDAFTELLDAHLREGEEVIVEAITKDGAGSESLGSILPKPKRF